MTKVAANGSSPLQLLHDVRAFKAKLLREEGSVDTVVLATHLAAVGYKVAIRTALGGGVGQECFHNLHYEFLLVTDEHNFVEYIVDPRFRYAPLSFLVVRTAVKGKAIRSES